MAASANTRASVIPYFGNDAEWKRQFANWVHAANKGHIANAGTVTLTPGTFSTSVDDARVATQSFIEFMPRTPSASEEKASGNMYVSTIDNQRFVVTHASNNAVDRTFTYIIWG